MESITFCWFLGFIVEQDMLPFILLLGCHTADFRASELSLKEELLGVLS